MSKRLVAAAIVFGLMTPAMLPAQPPQEGKKKEAREERREGNEQHPHIKAALRELQESRRELQTASHDFGGHRVEAIEAIDNAIKQLREALKYDKK
ncbi:MAG TPA: hypothetical protein VNW97_09610 [Candidatus Saccharimonadales bacterium]|jgi:hypothetical protein|nr:hypothetical protein [Candidatus Saccharimonadales bacterium]